MPIYNINEFQTQFGGEDPSLAKFGTVAPDTTDTKSPSFLDAVKAGWKADISTLGAIANHEEGSPIFTSFQNPSPEFETYMKKAQTDGYHGDQLDKFAYVDNEQQYNALKTQINQETQAREVMADAGWKGIAAGLLVGLTDPINFIPVGGEALTAIKEGATAIGAFKAGAKAGLVVSAAQQAALDQVSATITPEEMITNVGAGTILGGAMGTVIHGASGIIAKRMPKAEENLNSFLLNKGDNKGMDDSVITTPDQQSIGAAYAGKPITTNAQETVLQPENIIAKAAFNAANKTLGELSPINRLINSPFKSSKEIVQELSDISVALNKNTEGLATPDSVVSNVRVDESKLITATEQHQLNLKQFKTDTGLTRKEFNTRVAYALRRGDVDPDGNKSVTAAAQSWRKSFFDPFKDSAIEVKLLPEDVTPDTAVSYLNRIYSKEKISANISEWHETIKPHLSDMYDQEVAELSRVLNDPKSTPAAKDAAQTKLSSVKYDTKEAYIDEVSNHITDGILGFDQLIETTKVQAAERGPLKDRTFNIPDYMIEPYLESDVEDLAHRFYRIIAPEIQLQRKFGTTRFSMTDKAGLAKDIMDEMHENLKYAKNETESKALLAQAKNDLQDIHHIWELTRGTYRARKAPADDVIRRGLAAVRDFNYITKLGGATIASLSDPLIIAQANTYSRFFDANIGIALNSAVRQMNKTQARQIGKAANFVLNSRMRSLYELGDPYAKGTALERGLNNSAKYFSNLNLMNFWNDWWEQVSTLTNQQRIADGVFDHINGKLNQKDEIYLSKHGIGANMRSRIADQLAQHGEEIDGTRIFNTQNWTDAEAKRAVETGLNKAVSSEIIIKSPGDAPRFAEGSVGKTLTQFMSFGFAANNKLLLSGLQQADKDYLGHSINLMIAGTLIYALQEKLKGKEVSHDPKTLFIQALENMPQLVIPLYANRVADSAGVGLSNLTDHPVKGDVSNVLKTLGGAGVGTLADAITVGEVMKKIGNGKKPSASEIKTIRRLIPLNNVFYLRKFFDSAQQSVMDRYNIKEKQPKKAN